MARMTFRDRVVSQMQADGCCEEYIGDWCRVYDETGLDMRDMSDGMDVDAFLDAYEEGDFDEMMMLC